MNCTKARKYVHLAIDGDLSPRRAEALRRHLAACPECERIHRQLTALRGATRQLAKLSAQVGGHPRALEIASRRPIRRWTLAVGLAAVVALSVGAWKIAAVLRPASTIQTASTDHAPQTDLPPSPMDVPASVAASVPPPVRFEFSPGSNVVAVQHPTHSPNVTIIWVYPALQTAEASPNSMKPPDLPLKGAEL